MSAILRMHETEPPPPAEHAPEKPEWMREIEAAALQAVAVDFFDCLTVRVEPDGYSRHKWLDDDLTPLANIIRPSPGVTFDFNFSITLLCSEGDASEQISDICMQIARQALALRSELTLRAVEREHKEIPR